MNWKTTLLIVTAACSLFIIANSAHAQGMAFTYQGRLNANGVPATGLYDFKVDLFNDPTTGSVLGGPVTNLAVVVTNGLFTTLVDLGSSAFTGGSNWLHLQVRTNGGNAFTSLLPRQQVTPTPYALQSGSASNVLGMVAASQLSGSLPVSQISGTIPLAQLPSAVVTNNEGSVNLNGSFTGNGVGVTNLNASSLASGTVPDAQLASDVALTDATSQTFTGTNIFITGTNSGGSLIVQGSTAIDTSLFTGLGFQYNRGNNEAALIASYNDAHAALTFYTKPDTGVPVLEQVKIDRYGDVMIDQQNANSGALNNGSTNGAGLIFGTGGTAGIASQRTAGVNYHGLDLYTSSTRRLSILSSGNIGINTTNPGAQLDVAGTVNATAFTGNGAGLTALNANNLAIGTIALTQLPAAVLTNNEGSVNLNGSFTGNGGTLTNLQLSAVGPVGTFALLPYFLLPATYSAGFDPVSVVAADVKGNGHPYLICANSSYDTLTVLKNNGSGVFSFSATLPVGNAPNSVVAADVNGDGKPDLICANENSGTLTVLTNNGSGVFGSNATLTVGGYLYSVAAADVNGDGHPDLICASWNNDTLTVLTNNGSGVFGSNATLSAGGYPVFVTAADVNGDGHPDLICANEIGTLSVLTNNGSGVFGSNATLTVDSYPYSVVAVTNVDGQGHMALVCVDGNTNTLTVLTSNGSGVFSFEATLTVGNDPYSVVAADVNGDGKPDLICANASDGTLTVLTNNGSGVFGFYVTLAVGSYPLCVVAADVNGDGHPDLISANSGDATLTVLLSATNQLAVNDAVVFGNSQNMFTGSFNGVFNGSFNGSFTGGTLQVGAIGTTYATIQSGQAIMPSSSLQETNFTIVFPQAFSSTPKIQFTIANDPSYSGASDVFSSSVASSSSSSFSINVYRLDGTGWAQQLRINWQAWR